MLFNNMRVAFSRDFTWSFALDAMDPLALLKGLKLRMAEIILL